MARAHPHPERRQSKGAAVQQPHDPAVDSLSSQDQGFAKTGRDGHGFEGLMQTKRILPALVWVYTHPIVSGIITLLLASAAFLTGVVSGLGMNFVPFVQKSDLIGTLLFYLSMVLFAAGLLRVMALFIFNMFKERPQGVSWSPYYLGAVFWSFVTSLVVVTMVAIFIITLIPGYSSIIAVSVIINGLLLAALLILYTTLKRATALFLAQLLFLLSMFGLGRAWMDIQRLRPPTMQVHLKGGEIVLGNVVFTSPSGLLIFVSYNLSPEYHSWDQIDKVMLKTMAGEKYEPFVSEESMKAVVRAFCRLKGAMPKGMRATGQTDTDCLE
jgi:hypothetical protein